MEIRKQVISSVAPPTSTTRDRVRTWAEICQSQSNSEGFSPGTRIFFPLQIRFSRQDLSRRAFKHYPLARKNGATTSFAINVK